MLRVVLSVLLAVVLLLGCSGNAPKSGIDISGMDKTVRPQEDFYRYVNGTWLEKTEIPADRSRYGSFTVLYEEAQVNLRKIIEESANMENKKPGSPEQKVGDFYTSYMDSSQIEALGLKPLEKELERIAAVKTDDDLRNLMAHFMMIGVQLPFTAWVDQDAKQSDQYIVYFHQSGLGLPDRDYYFKKDEKFSEIRDKYVKHIEKIFKLAGISDGASLARKIMKIETKLAQNHWTRAETRDRDKAYNKFAVNKLDRLTPKFNWAAFMAAIDAGEANNVIIRQPSYIKAFGKILKKVSLADWKAYYTWKLLDEFAPDLPAAFVDANFEFYSKTLRGVEKNRPRWKRAVAATNNVLGEVVGQIYVQRHFKPEAKKRMVELVNNLKLAFKESIDELDWMSEETKKQAKAKLAKFNTKIGYPDKWKDYSGLEIKADDLIGNLLRSRVFEHHREIKKLGKPIDRDEWFMTPQTVNAYYSPNMNEIVFPAAILQPPFFNFEADDAVNYGAIGAVIGHELTHGFDDQGRKSDGDGNLREWWTEEDATKFTERARLMIEQYESYYPLGDSMHINGKLTLGENIADLGGLTIAYKAYKKSLKGKEAPVIDGYTGDQRFFMGIAQVWRNKYRDEALRQRLLTDSHSPPRYRVLGALSNMPEFYAAFDVKPGDPMYRDENKRVKIW